MPDAIERNIVLGLEPVQHRNYATRGIGRYARGYANALCALHPDRVARIELDARRPPVPGLEPGPVSISTAGDLGTPPPRPIVFHGLAPFSLEPLRASVPRWARAGDTALVFTLYDVIPLHDRERYLGSAAGSRWHTRAGLVGQADALLAISERAAADAVDLLGADPRRVHVVGAATTPRLAQPEVLPPNSVPGAVMCVGGADERKNLERLVRAYLGLDPRLRERHPLVIAGYLGKPISDKLLTIVAGAGAGAHADVRLTGLVSDGELSALYEASAVAVFPSLEEGFGLPALEGLEAGLPVLVSDVDPLRAIVGDPAARFDPRSVEAIRAGLERALTDTAWRRSLAERSAEWAAPFTWERVVDRSLVAYEAAARERTRSVRRRPRRRLQIVTPLPPLHTGIAAYSERLVTALARHLDVDVHVEDGVTAATEVAGRRVYPAHLLGVRAALDPSTLPALFVFGNSRHHVQAWRGLLRHGGDVLLHEARLLGLYQELGERGILPGGMPHALRRIEGAAWPPRFHHRMLDDVIDGARRVYVHTEAARAIVLARRPEREADVSVVPFAVPPTLARAPAGGPPLIVHVGHLLLPDELLAALVPVLETQPAARVVLAGTGTMPGEVERVRTMVAERGLADRIEVPGWLAGDDYDRLLARATVAVQLRHHDATGERSAAIADCLAAGVPTLTNALGDGAGLPDDVLVRVPPWPRPGTVASALGNLLADADRRERLSAAATAYAAENGAERAAVGLLEAMSAPDRQPAVASPARVM